MKKTLPLIIVHRLFTAAALLIVAVFLGFLAYLYIAFYGTLTGDITSGPRPDLLVNLDAVKFQHALGRMQTRASLPDIPPDLPDPYRQNAAPPAAATPPGP